MKIKVLDILNAQEKLESLAKEKLKPANSFRIARLLKKLGPELDTFNEKRNDLIRNLGEIQKDEEGNDQVTPLGDPVYSIPPDSENFKAFSDSLSEIVQEEIEIDMEKLQISTLDEIQLTVIEASLLEPFFQ